MHKATVVHPLQPAGGEPPRKRQFKLPLNLWSRDGGLIQAFPIGIGYGSHIRRILQPSLDLQTGHADPLQLRQELPGSKILG